jgi:hypothetical protein
MNSMISAILAMAKALVPEIGAKARPAVVRSCTLPQGDVESLCMGMSAADEAEAIALGRKKAEAEADFVMFVASQGAIRPGSGQ